VSDARYVGTEFDASGPATRMSGRDIYMFGVCTPSRANVFSIRGYDVDRVTGAGATPLDASLGDSLNPLVMHTTNPPKDTYTAFAFVASTADAQSLTDLSDAFAFAGLTDELNLDAIPSDGSFLFSDDDLAVPRDLWSPLLRVIRQPAYPNLTPAGEPLNFTLPFTFGYLFRSTGAPRVPIDVVLRKTHSLVQEIPRLFGFWFDRLVRDVVRHFETDYGMTLLSDTPLDETTGAGVEGKTAALFDHGFACIAAEEDCGLDDRDDLYVWDQQSHLLGDSDFYLLVGLNYANPAGNESYPKLKPLTLFNSVGAYRPSSSPPFGLVGDLNQGELAAPPLAGIVPVRGFIPKRLAEKSFLAQVARPQNCIGGIPGICPDTGELALADPMVIFGQLTLNPWTATMPDPDQYRHGVPWRLLHFQVSPP
jgi:hypothetical protein